MTVEYFMNNPDYSLRWPSELFAEEVKSLYRRGMTVGADYDWEREVVRLLQEAFVSSVPAKDFERKRLKKYDAEPF